MLPHVDNDKEDLIDDFSYGHENIRLKWYDRILLNKPLRVVVTLILVTIVSPLLLYYYVFFPSFDHPPSDGFSTGSCLVPRHSRLPCGVEAVIPALCHAQCCYDHQSNMCFQRYPSRFSYLIPTEWSEGIFLQPRIPTVPYGSQRSLTNIRLSIDEVSSTHLSLTFYHTDQNVTGRRIEEKKYDYRVLKRELSVIVNGSQGNIFSTARGPLIASNNIWEIAFKLTNETNRMYGLGEIPLKGGTVKVIYNHDRGLSSVPLIFAQSNNAYHGLLIESKAPTEVIIRENNQVIVRSITPWGLKFHLFVGPKPVDIMKDVKALLGFENILEYWMLGVHICSELPTATVANLRTFISQANTQRLPFDSHCGTVPVVFKTECDRPRVSLINQGATQIRNARKKFVPHVSPYIKYTRLVRENDTSEAETRSTQRCFDDELYENYNIRDPDTGNLYEGEVDGDKVIYPNYENVSEEFIKSLWQYNLNFEGVVLENNWPLDESEKDFNDINDYLPYFNENFEAAFNYTPQWNAIRHIVVNETDQSNDTQLNSEKYFVAHNEYGNQFADAFEKIKGPIPTYTTSQWMRGNAIVNRQNVPTTWTNFNRELIEVSLGGISGHWYWSSPICGDTENFNVTTHLRLCAKWYMAATYMPMIKIHSKEFRRDPLAYTGVNRAQTLRALTIRMSLLPYFYTVLQEGPLMRPMFYQFPWSDRLKDMTSQFAIGDDLVIVPNLIPNQTHVHFWIPPGTWYDFWSGLKIDGEEGQAVTLPTAESDFVTMMRGGSIIVMQKNTQLTADLTRLQSVYSLIIALDCDNSISAETTVETTAATTVATEGDELTYQTPTTITEATEQSTCQANGKLYMTENITIKFEANGNKLKITALGDDFRVFCITSGAIWSRSIRELSIYGLNDDQNNNDNFRNVATTIDLCQLQNNDEIVFKFVD